jgi:uncharacterized protein
VSDALRPVPLQELRLLVEGRRWSVEQPLGELDSLTLVRGELRAIHRGNVLEVSGQAETIVTLRCDRCLRDYNHQLVTDAQELIWLGEPAAEADKVLELDPESLSETLDPRGSFDPARWLFEQLHLQLPFRNDCGPLCPGPDLPPEASRQPVAGDAVAEPAPDSRWAALRDLRLP